MLKRTMYKINGACVTAGFMVLGPIQHYVRNNLKLEGGHMSQIGSVIGTHIGPSAAGIAFVIPPEQ